MKMGYVPHEKIRVRFKGEEYIWMCRDNAGALAYLHHFDEEGNLNLDDAFFSNSFAHVFRNGEIKRYNQVIGHVEDLEFVTATQGVEK